MLTEKDINDRVSYYMPTERAITLHGFIRDNTKDFMTLIENKLPECREKSLAITKLEEVMFWANAAIARNHDKL
jgi:hypothetical protein